MRHQAIFALSFIGISFVSNSASAQDIKGPKEKEGLGGLAQRYGRNRLDAGPTVTTPPANFAADIEKERVEIRGTRERRRKEELEDMKAKWANILDKPAFKDEMRKHRRRMARLHYIARIAKVTNDTAIGDRARVALQKEGARHGTALMQLKSRNGELK